MPELNIGTRVAEVWQALAAGAEGRSAALKQFVLCTCAGAAAHGRIVVLRAVDPGRATLTFFSDARAAKMTQLQQPASAVFWDPQEQLQLRLQGQASAASDEALIEAWWQRVGEHGRRNYRALQTPGSAVADAGACAGLGDTSGRENFSVVRLAATRLDALWLSRGERLQMAFASESGHWVQM